VIDEPDEVRRYGDALRRGVFPYVIIDVPLRPPARDVEALKSAYVLLFEVAGSTPTDRYTVWQRQR
jgi:hypothetical protein